MSSVNQKHQTAQIHSREIEAILHASETPVTAKQLRSWLSLSQSELDTAIIMLQDRLAQGALTLFETASGYRLQIANQFSALIQQVFPQRQENLSQALLETLSVIAYKQPVTRGDIEQIRGVTVSSRSCDSYLIKVGLKNGGSRTLSAVRHCYIRPMSFWMHLGLPILMNCHRCRRLGKSRVSYPFCYGGMASVRCLLCLHQLLTLQWHCWHAQFAPHRQSLHFWHLPRHGYFSEW